MSRNHSASLMPAHVLKPSLPQFSFNRFADICFQLRCPTQRHILKIWRKGVKLFPNQFDAETAIIRSANLLRTDQLFLLSSMTGFSLRMFAPIIAALDTLPPALRKSSRRGMNAMCVLRAHSFR